MSIACTLCGIVGAVLLIRSIRRDRGADIENAENNAREPVHAVSQ